MYVNMYTGNPTADGTDGVLVSSAGALTSPISAMAGAEEEVIVPCAVRCVVAGYTAYVCHISVQTRSGSTYIAGSDWISLSLDGENWSTNIDVMNVGSTNKIFYVKISGGTVGGYDDTGALLCNAEIEEDE